MHSATILHKPVHHVLRVEIKKDKWHKKSLVLASQYWLAKAYLYKE